MRRRTTQWLIAIILPVAFLTGGAACSEPKSEIKKPAMILLARPSMKGTLSVEEALAARRSVRQYTAEPLTLEMVSRLLWAAQGQTATWGGRTAPSAGALFPIEVTVVVGEVSGLEAGVYGYRNDRHALERRLEGDTREALAAAALGQGCLRDAPVVLVLSAVYERTKKKYGERGVRYAQIEIGAVCENLYLQAESLGLGTVLVGAFYDDEISEVLDLGRAETPLVLMPIGYPSVAVSD